LPAITSPVFLDGSTQPGISDWPKIIIKGTLLPSFPSYTDGLTISGHGADGSTINGISIVGCSGDGLEINGSDQNVITGSTFGESSLGGLGNQLTGIHLNHANQNVLGGSAPG